LLQQYDRSGVIPELGLHPATKFNLKRFNSSDISYGSTACWLSHLQVYFDVVDKAAAGTHSGPVLILEDDL